MKLKEVVLKGVRKYQDRKTFNFAPYSNINTISGKNGAGKSTVFEALIKVQKAYFCKKLTDAGIDFSGRNVEEEIAKDLYIHMNDDKSYIEVCFSFDNLDQQLLGMPEPEIEEVAAAGTMQAEEREIRLTLKAKRIINEQVEWEIDISEDDEVILAKYWNLQKPQNIIAYVSSNKNIVENDITFTNLKLKQDKQVSPIVNFIFDPYTIFERLYELFVNDYLYEKLLPVNRKGPAPRKDLYYHITKVLFAYIMPDLQLVNLSGTKRENQFVFFAKTRGSQRKIYDLRNFSSGEKFIWYILLFINYIKNMGILIIDEPENHLHEELSCKLSMLLSDITTSDSYIEYISRLNIEQKALSTLQSELQKGYRDFRINQVFLLTHSKSLIYHNFSKGTNFVLSDELASIDYETCEKTLRQYGISYVNDKILFVEGKTDVKTLEKVLDRYNIKVKPLENCNEIIRTFEGISRINRFLMDPMFVFLIDRDTRTSGEIENLRGKDEVYFDKHFVVMEKHELENYFLEQKIIHRVLKQHESESYTAPTEEEIERVILDKANEQLLYTKKKYLNYQLNYKMERMKMLIKQSDLQVDNREQHSNYIEGLFASNGTTMIKQELVNLYDQMDNNFNEENWRTNWHNLMDGKSVFNKVSAELSTAAEIRSSRLQREIKDKSLEIKDSQLNQLILKIVVLFGETFDEIVVEEMDME